MREDFYMRCALPTGSVRPNRHWTDEELLSRCWAAYESDGTREVSWRDLGVVGALVLVGVVLTVLLFVW